MVLKGIIKSKKCSYCGHHEIGVIDEESKTYMPLKIGDKVTVEGGK